MEKQTLEREVIFGSVCSGIDAASVAWEPLGWRAAFFSETADWPRAFLSWRYPHVPLHGDFTTIKRGVYADVDVLVGGTPCQSFSTSGQKRGLADDRGNLSLAFAALAEELAPEWVVWENVAGVLSNDGGRSFGTFLGALARGGYGFAYRVLDAQYVRVDGIERAVPHERRRVIVVGHRDWRRAAIVLLEPERGERSFGAGGRARHTSASEISGDPGGVWALNSHSATAAGTVTNNSHKRGGPVGLGVRPDVAYSLRAGRTSAIVDIENGIVRRMTPTECERAMGLPDGYSAMPGSSDQQRWAAIGNSMPVNIMRWVGRRIEEHGLMMSAFQ